MAPTPALTLWVVDRATAGTAVAFAGYSAGPWPFLWALGMVLLVGVLSWTVTVIWTAYVTHRPPRMTAGRALARLGRAWPSDVGLNQFEEVVFNVPDVARPGGRSIALAAWWIAHPAGASASRRTCLMLHGYGDSRAGALAWAPVWQRLGFHLLLLDLRAHGDSGGRLSGGGAWEKPDVHAAIDQLRALHPSAARDVVLFGVSYGAMVAAAAAAERDDVAALVLDSPVDGWASATRRYADLLGLPLAHAHKLRLRLMEEWLGVRFESVRPVHTLPHVKCPVLAILPRQDVLVSSEEADAIEAAVLAAAAPRGGHVWRPATTHNLALAADAAEYERRIRAFLAECMGTAAAAPNGLVRAAP